MLYLANLGFFLNYTDGTKKDEIESDIFRIVLQDKESIPYDRANGGSFEEVEQEKYSPYENLLLISRIVESIYRLNAKRNFDPYIVIGGTDIKTDFDAEKGKMIVYTQYALLQNLKIKGKVETAI